MDFKVRILGSNSALPAYGRHPSAQVLKYRDDIFLIDCGEGTQMRMDEAGVKKNRIKQIFISHLHGDHFFGLFGLLQSYNLMHRSEPLQVIAPLGIKEVVECILNITGNPLNYPLELLELNHVGVKQIFENRQLTVTAFPLEHRVPTYGYIFGEKKGKRNLDGALLDEYGVPGEEREKIRAGADYITSSGKVIKASAFVVEEEPARKYAYCSDTRPFEAQKEILTGVTTLYHEATFLEEDRERAEKTMHTTSLQAALLALKVGVKKLIVGHFSSRYKDIDTIREEASTVFKETYAAEEGEVFDI
nr:ribonuclease Z [Saprospiraceae bacterium]